MITVFTIVTEAFSASTLPSIVVIAATPAVEIAIPAGPPNANGANHLYRLRATSAGQLEVQIPFEPAASGSPQLAYAVTINAH